MLKFKKVFRIRDNVIFNAQQIPGSTMHQIINIRISTPHMEKDMNTAIFQDILDLLNTKYKE